MSSRLLERVMGNLKKGLMVIVSAPAGTGKTTLVKRLIKEHAPSIVQSISCTTRRPRPGEIDGKDYFFISPEAFEEKRKKGEFLEWASVFGAQYGTLKGRVEDAQASGKHVLLVIDSQGAHNLQKKNDMISIFIAPPNLETLQKRLENRKSESIREREGRLQWATVEMERAKYYDYRIINGDFEIAYTILESILIAESHRFSSRIQGDERSPLLALIDP